MTVASRWVLVPVFVLSIVLWMGISSVTTNAVHVLAKSSFAMRPFGTVSGWLLASAIIWPLLLSYAMVAYLPLGAKAIAQGSSVVAIWGVAIIAMIAIGDEILGRIGGWAVAVWVIEIVGAGLLLRLTNQLSLADPEAPTILLGAIASLIWLTLTKAALLCISPGVVIRM